MNTTNPANDGPQAAEAPLYPEQDHMALGDYYLRHVDAMTGEGLHAKSAIAAQLAWRDRMIDRYKAALRDLQVGADAARALAEPAGVGRYRHVVCRCDACLALPGPAPINNLVSVIQADADNYCRILRLLGMEEEGDAAEEVERLVALDLAARGDQAAVPVAWRHEAAAWMLRKSAGQRVSNARWPDHAKAYPEWEKRAMLFRWIAEQLMAEQEEAPFGLNTTPPAPDAPEQPAAPELSDEELRQLAERVRKREQWIGPWALEVKLMRAAIALHQARGDLRTHAERALAAWDSTVLPKANDGAMQERMEDLRAALGGAKPDA